MQFMLQPCQVPLASLVGWASVRHSTECDGRSRAAIVEAPMRTSSDSTYTRTVGVISASNSGGISDIRVMHEMSQISPITKRPIPARDRLR